MSVLLKFVKEVESAFEIIDDGAEKKRAAYNRAAKAGLNKNALCEVISLRRKYGANPPAYITKDHAVRQYLSELDSLGDDALPRIRVRGPAK